jgi:hypothetical protein
VRCLDQENVIAEVRPLADNVTGEITMMQLLRKLFPLALVMLFVAMAETPARAQQPQPEAQPPLYLGTAWYPEQWPESRWDAAGWNSLRSHHRVCLVVDRADRGRL